ncbi:hypothetical protein SDC9_145040 [bioreactor metagenome]|uniref:Uncharacterized protein n=1 Tax=bioreactor metagenome TaxID=1076179 RepID=A0A645E7W5_9ZZZZ
MIMNSIVANEIKTELNSAKVYAEGRAIRVDIKDNVIIKDIRELIDIKLKHY